MIESKAGREAILGKVIIDCTGDGDVAFRAGVPCEKGDARGGMQPPTLMFCLAGVDTEKLRQSLSTDRRPIAPISFRRLLRPEPPVHRGRLARAACRRRNRGLCFPPSAPSSSPAFAPAKSGLT